MVWWAMPAPSHAHVAVVRRIVSPREIRVDHANWLNNGAIFLDDPVADISPGNDWSEVLVWNVQTHAWGGAHLQCPGLHRAWKTQRQRPRGKRRRRRLIHDLNRLAGVLRYSASPPFSAPATGITSAPREARPRAFHIRMSIGRNRP